MYPSDGVWLQNLPDIGELPVAAIEVVVSEGPKSLRGSLLTLEEISPAMGVLLLHDSESWRGAVSRGKTVDRVATSLLRRYETAIAMASKSRQRIEVWTDAELQRRLELATGDNRVRRTHNRGARSSGRVHN